MYDRKKRIIVYPDADPQILDVFPSALTETLKALGEYRIYEGAPPNTREYIERVKEADAILLGWGIPNEVLKHCHNLQIISFTGTGAENFIDIPFATSQGITITTTPGYGDQSVAEHTVGLMFSVAKNIPLHDSRVKAGTWDQSKPSKELRDKTVGVIGLGGIGRLVAQLCSALGMKVIGWTKHPDDTRAKRYGLTFVPLEYLLRQSDIVTLHLPLSQETRGFLDGKRLKLIKRGAIFINTARAELVDTNVLVNLLNEGKIAGAGLDVFDDEPLPKDHPLLRTQNVILTPHIAFNTPEAIERLLRIAVDNLEKYFEGNAQNVVNPETLNQKGEIP